MHEATDIYNQGVGHLEADRFDDAIAAFSEAILLEPGLALAYNGRGVTLAVSGSPEAAIADFCEAIRLEPTEPRFFRARAIVYAELGEDEKSQADYARAGHLEAAFAAC